VEKQPKNVRDSASKKTSQGLRDNFLDALQAKFEVASASLIYVKLCETTSEDIEWDTEAQSWSVNIGDQVAQGSSDDRVRHLHSHGDRHRWFYVVVAHRTEKEKRGAPEKGD
jgi:hypothetical protein